MGPWREDTVEWLGDGELVGEAAQYRHAVGLMERNGFDEGDPDLLALRDGLRVLERELIRRGLYLWAGTETFCA